MIGAGRPRPAPTLGMVMGFFKSECTKQIRRLTNDPKLEIWQRNYYEHVIRNDRELFEIRQYIENNSAQWELDENNPDRVQLKLS